MKRPTHKKLPALAIRGILIDHAKADMDSHYACIPGTPAQAKQIVKAAEFLRLPEDDKAEVMANAAWHHLNKKTKWEDANAHARTSFRLIAFAQIAAMGMGGAKL